MATYVTLVNWTEQGVRGFQDTVKRQAAAKELAQSLGGKAPQFFWTMGAYDAVGISEFPDDESATAFALALSSLGSVRTTTLRAFDPNEMTRIVDKAVGRGASTRRSAATKKAKR